MFKGSSQDLRSIKVVRQRPRLEHSFAVVGCQTLELGSSGMGQNTLSFTENIIPTCSGTRLEPDVVSSPGFPLTDDPDAQHPDEPDG